jgi:hypothetical protein
MQLKEIKLYNIALSGLAKGKPETTNFWSDLTDNTVEK